MNAHETKKILDDVDFLDCVFHLILKVGHGLFLQVQFVAPCNDTGEEKLHKGRKWYLSPHATKSEVVQTAFLAALTAVEHEAREAFTYKGAQVYGPHGDVDAFARLPRDKRPEQVH